MSRNILILLYDYYPECTANTICIDYVMKELKKVMGQVHVFCIKNSYDEVDTQVMDQVDVHRHLSWEHIVMRNARKSKLSLARKFVYHYYHNMSFYGVCGYTECYEKHAAVKEAKKIIEDYSITHILSVSYPFSSHVLASKLKMQNPQLRWIAYELDPFSYNFTLPRKQLLRRKKLELEILSRADGIISTLGIDEYNEQMQFRSELREKTLRIPLPGLETKSTGSFKARLKNKGSINLVYAGQFYGALRSPKPILTLLNKINRPDIVLHLIGGSVGSLENYPNVMVQEYPRCEQRLCEELISDADIAINLDNNIPNQVPSKILTYMSLKMPIVNFYFKNAVLGESYLSAYSNHLSISVDSVELDDTSADFLAFVDAVQKKAMCEESIPEYLSNQSVCQTIKAFILG